MKVSCPSCQTNYNIDDKRIPAGGAKLKCARCQNTFAVRPESAQEEASASLPLPAPAGAGAVPLPSAAAGGASAVPLPSARSPAAAAIPLPSAAPAAGAIPLPAVAPGSGAIPLPSAARAPAAATAIPLPSVARAPTAGAVPLPGAVPLGKLRPAPVPDEWADIPTNKHRAPLPKEAFPEPAERSAAIPLPSRTLADDQLPVPASDFGDAVQDFSDVPFDTGSAVPVEEGFDAPLSTARDFDFDDAPPAPAPAGAPSETHELDFSDLPSPASPAPAQPQEIDFSDLPSPAPASSSELDFSDLPSPASAAPSQTHDIDFGDLPAPASPAPAFEDFAPPPPTAAEAVNFSDLPTPSFDDLPSPSFADLPAPSAPVEATSFEGDFGDLPPPEAVVPPNPSTDFGDVDFGEGASFPDAFAEPAPASASHLEMLDGGGDAPAPDFGPAGSRLHVRRRSGKVFGPFDEAAIVQMLEDGQLLGNEDLSSDETNWTPIGTVPTFAAALQRIMEGGANTVTSSSDSHAAAPSYQSSPAASSHSDPLPASMDRMKQSYEGRMAAVSVVDRSAAAAELRRRIPFFIAGGVIVLLFLAGASMGFTRYGAFGFKKIFPSRLSNGSPAAADFQLARKELLQDTYRGYSEAKRLTSKVLTGGEYPEVRALWCQAIFYLHRRYAAATPAELTRARQALPDIALLGDRNLEVLKAQAGAALASGKPDEVLTRLQDAASREINQQDVELPFLLAETFAAKGKSREAISTLTKVLRNHKDLAKAQHALGNLYQTESNADAAAQAYEAALAADPLHVISAVELAAVQLLVRKDLEKGDEALKRALDPKAQEQMGPAELARARSLQGVVYAQQFKLKEAEEAFKVSLEKDPSNVFTQLNLARLYRSQRRFSDALPLYKAIATREPTVLEYTEGYITTLVASGNMSEALKVVEAANTRFPSNALIAFLFGRIDEARDNASDAETHYKRAIAAAPELFEAQLQLARFYLRYRRMADARVQLEQAVTKASEHPGIHAGMGELALAEGNRPQALIEFQKAVALNPNLADGHLGLSRLALAEGQFDVALAEVEKALALSPIQLPGGKLQKGLVLSRMGQLDAAIEELEQAKNEEPRNITIPIALGNVRLTKGDLGGAESNIALALTAEPSNPEALYTMGKIKAARAEYTQAIDHMRSAVDRAPKRADYRVALGIIFRDAKRINEAVEQWKLAVELDPQSADAHEALGQASLDRGDFEGAIASFEAALKADPQRHRVLGSIGDAYFSSTQWAEAVRRYQVALRTDPTLVHLFYKIGRSYTEQQQHTQAIEWYRRAAAADKDNAMPHYYLGFAFKEKGRKSDAVQAFRQYLERRPDAEDKKDIEDEIYDLTH